MAFFILSRQTWHERASIVLPYSFTIEFFLQAKGDDHQSVAAALIREVERNKLSSRERSWLAATL
jgi:hypothetical protein